MNDDIGTNRDSPFKAPNAMRGGESNPYRGAWLIGAVCAVLQTILLSVFLVCFGYGFVSSWLASVYMPFLLVAAFLEPSGSPALILFACVGAILFYSWLVGVAWFLWRKRCA